ncbi:MAG: phage virion morphogenesis protein [Motiliproteus sp.]
MSLTVSVSGDLALRDQLKLLRLPPAKRKRYHRLLGKEVAKLSRRRVKAQQNIDGTPWKQRKKGRKKMLAKITRPKHLKVYAGSESVKVTWSNRLMGQIARQQQEGIGETMTAKRAARVKGKPDYQSDATASQAKALVKAGFKIYAGKYKSGAKGGQSKTRRVSQRWIRENMTLGQAGLVLRLLRDEPSKQSWDIPLPPRSFLGLSAAERGSVGQELLGKMADDAVSKRIANREPRGSIDERSS